MNINARLKTSCAIYDFTASGAPLNTKTWSLTKSISVMFDQSRAARRYAEDGTTLLVDGVVYALCDPTIKETSRLLFGSKYYEIVSVPDMNELGKEAQIEVKRLVGGVSDN